MLAVTGVRICGGTAFCDGRGAGAVRRFGDVEVVNLERADVAFPLARFYKRHDIGYLAQLEAEFFPFFEVCGYVNVAAIALGASNAEILLERGVTLDAQVVVGGVLPDVVGVAIDGEFAHPGSEN